uniref:DNA/RNA non-specific endonuclease n=1 Tax=Fulvivirga sp. TaxID=1931237 RepID=UPI00404B378E
MAKRSPIKSSPSKKPTSSRSKAGGKGKGNSNILLLVVLAVVVFLIGAFALNMLGDFEKDQIVHGKTISSPDYKNDQPLKNKSADKIIFEDQSGNIEEADESEIKVETGLETKTRNKEIQVADKVDEFYFTESFDFGWPAYDQNDQIIEHEAYALRYNEETEQADWVAYRLMGYKLRKNTTSRTEQEFVEDELVRTGSATLEDYRNSGYDRGHFIPAADVSWSVKAMSESFLLSNMSPQLAAFNRGIWMRLENKVRDWALVNRELRVVTGPIFGKKPKVIGKNKVAVPEAFYKIILDITEPEVKALAFIVPHAASDENILTFAVSIDEIEQLTGLDFFPLLPADIEKKLESTVNKAPW